MKWLALVLAVVGAIGGILLARRSVAPQPVPPPIAQPVRNPFASGIAGGGIIEAASENISIGVGEPGLVTKVYITEGQPVKANDPLFETDSRPMRAQLLVAQATLASAEAELQRVKAYRRPEEEAPLKARHAQAEATLLEAQRFSEQARAAVVEAEWAAKDADARVRRLEITVKANASTEEELERVQFIGRIAKAKVESTREAVKVAQAREIVARANLQQAQAELEIFRAGAWPPDVQKAAAAAGEAKARVEQIQIEIERRTVRSPIDGTVIRLSLRQGEFAVASNQLAENAPVVIGDVKRKNVRVDIDEFDTPRYITGAKAVAFLKGNTDHPIPLEFDHIEPFIIPKRSLTNSQREIVDVRVLQVIYRIADPAMLVYPGQQVDVFIEAPPLHVSDKPSHGTPSVAPEKNVAPAKEAATSAQPTTTARTE